MCGTLNMLKGVVGLELVCQRSSVLCVHVQASLCSATLYIGPKNGWKSIRVCLCKIAKIKGPV